MLKSKWIDFFWKDLFKKSLAKSQSREDFLQQTSFFQGFSPFQVHLMCEFLHSRQYVSGEHIFEVGHPGAALYFIEAGQVSIELPSEKGASPIAIALLEAGSFFGELALLDDAPRSASARAVKDVTVLALPRYELDRMLAQSPVLGGLVYRSLAQITSTRLKGTIDRLQKEDRTMKVAVNG
ncbi:MAG: Crp/Fnr family transcriptional regulator [Bdellovibrionales bacterium]